MPISQLRKVSKDLERVAYMGTSTGASVELTDFMMTGATEDPDILERS
jgi:hypothetical protein